MLLKSSIKAGKLNKNDQALIEKANKILSFDDGKRFRGARDPNQSKGGDKGGAGGKGVGLWGTAGPVWGAW